MASTSKRDSIADDWEDVGDDNLSIVSLSGSEEDVPVTELAGLTVREPAFTGASTTETTTVHGSDDASLRYTGKGREIGTESKSGENNSGDDRHNEHLLSQDCSTAQPLFAPSASECLNFEPDEFEQDGNGEPLVSGDVNPDELLGNIDSVREILHDTIHSGNELPTLQLETWGKALTLCRTLAMQVEELRPIVVGYARVWRNSSTDIPLDPGLYSWLSGVRAKALGLQVECRDEMTRTLGLRERTANRVLQDICKDLETFEQQMDEFLPILQVDFNEFQTQDMSIPTAAAGFETLRTMSPARSAPISIPQPTAHISGRNGFVPARPTASISILRTELYRLMDEIEPAVGRLSRLSQHLTHSAGKLAADIAEQYRRVFRAISTMLSNHGSEWIDHGLSGGLTYAEFAQLDADCIRDFAAQLNKVLASMEVEAVHRGPMTLESGLTGTALAGEAIIDGDSALDQLEVLVQVLSATFCVETR